MRVLEHGDPPPVVGLVIAALMWWLATLPPALPRGTADTRWAR